jgi:hypothetical protein
MGIELWERKEYEMYKIIFFMLFTILTEPALFSQSGVVLKFDEADFTCFTLQKTVYKNTGEIKLEKLPIEFSGITCISFDKKDSLTMISQNGKSYQTRLDRISDVSKHKSNLNPFLGIGIGVVSGALIGGLLGSAVKFEIKHEEYIFENLIIESMTKSSSVIGGALIGAIGGGLIGALITTIVNNAALDLNDVPDKRKKAELIRFLKEK